MIDTRDAEAANAITTALNNTLNQVGLWLPMSMRYDIADDVLTELYRLGYRREAQ